MRQLVWLDLCSGLGGASQPALDRGWKVIRVDIDPRFKPDIVADVRNLPLRPFHVDVLWASPPCQQFSIQQMRCFYPDPAPPDLSIAQSVKSVIKRWAPAAWYVENVWASRPFLTPLFGPVRARIPGHAIWSNLGTLFPEVRPHKFLTTKINARGFRDSAHQRFGGGKNGESSMIPYEIGEAICRAVENRMEG